MATKDLSHYDKNTIPDAQTMRIGIVVSEWNNDITDNLLKGCLDTLLENKVSESNIRVAYVPGSFELPMGAQLLIENSSCDAVICLGCVIQGETPHFDFVCQTCADGVKDVSLKFSKPVIFGVLTDSTKEQSMARSGGSKGNKGIEAAITAIKMVGLGRTLKESSRN